MPLTEKGKEVLSKMQQEYGPERGERVFYSSRIAGTISGVDTILGLHGGTSGGLVPVKGPSGRALSGVDSICGFKHE